MDMHAINILEANRIQVEDEIWIANLGITNHMTNKREWFKNFIEASCSQKKVYITNNIVLDVAGFGDIEVSQFVNNKIYKGILKSVMYVPQMKYNLFSIIQAINKKYKILFKDKTCVFISEDECLCLKGVLENNNIFKLLIKVIKKKCNKKTMANIDPQLCISPTLKTDEFIAMWQLKMKKIQDDMNVELNNKEFVNDSVKDEFVSSKELALNNCSICQSF